MPVPPGRAGASINGEAPAGRQGSIGDCGTRANARLFGMDMSEIALGLAPAACAVGILKYRSDYRRFGRTTLLGVVLLFAAWIAPHVILGFSIPMFVSPERPLQFVGYGLMALGLALALIPMRRFSPRMVVGRDQKRLVTSNIYRFSRNPQYTGYALFPLGYALTGQSLLAWVGVALFLVLMHLTVLVEEEHLERCFGEEYLRYKERTPRYLFF